MFIQELSTRQLITQYRNVLPPASIPHRNIWVNRDAEPCLRFVMRHEDADCVTYGTQFSTAEDDSLTITNPFYIVGSLRENVIYLRRMPVFDVYEEPAAVPVRLNTLLSVSMLHKDVWFLSDASAYMAISLEGDFEECDICFSKESAPLEPDSRNYLLHNLYRFEHQIEKLVNGAGTTFRAIASVCVRLSSQQGPTDFGPVMEHHIRQVISEMLRV